MPLPASIIEVLTVCATIVYDPDVEETDDVVNRNAASPGTPHGCGSPACQWQRYGRQLEQLRIRCSMEHDGLLWQ
jgi:hypothetical protein